MKVSRERLAAEPERDNSCAGLAREYDVPVAVVWFVKSIALACAAVCVVAYFCILPFVRRRTRLKVVTE